MLDQTPVGTTPKTIRSYQKWAGADLVNPDGTVTKAADVRKQDAAATIVEDEVANIRQMVKMGVNVHIDLADDEVIEKIKAQLTEDELAKVKFSNEL